MKRGIILLNKDKHAVFIRIQKIFKEENSYEEKKQNRHSLCSGAVPADARHGSRGKNKAKTGSKEKDNNRRADIPFEIKRGVQKS